ncbi:MAG: restriction endonuclease subunit S [Sulfuritalea sp.]|nr:restriction endonuclease subunit S [Sulfuritalea sp.]
MLPFMLQRSVAVLGPDHSLLQPAFLARVLQSPRLQGTLQGLAQGVAQKGVYLNSLRELQIPLPPLEVQKEIVAEIEGYQKVINGARAVLDHYRPHIPIHPDWPMVELSELCSFKNGLNFDKTSSGHTVKIIGVSDFQANLYAPLDDLDEVHLTSPLGDDYLVKAGDILFRAVQRQP